ncbi:MAG: SIMPL domain-containing protein [Paracoccaceae bacterium]
MRIVTALVTILALAQPLSAAETGESRPATISVTGEGRVETKPDMATISLGVMTEDDSARAALAANSEQIATVIARLKAAGIEDRDIQTTGLSLSPRYDYSRSDGNSKLTGYVVSNMVTVRVRMLDDLGKVLDDVVADGANNLNGLSFGLQDDAEAMDEARRRSVADARHKAELYAGAAGVTLGRIVTIGEQGGYAPQPMMLDAPMARMQEGSVPVASGELTVTSQVTVVYELAE